MKMVLVSDYDQTFYLNDEDIEINKKEIEKFRKQGNIFIIATGRSYYDFKNKSDKYNIAYDYVILNHGATAIDNKDNVIFNFSINNDIIQNIKQDICLDKVISNICCSELESRVDFSHKDLTKINAKYDNKDKAMKINDTINKKYSKYVNSYYVTSNSIEIISNETNKSIAIGLLAQNINIDLSNIYTVGDGYSDIGMVKDFNGYCMKESVEELKKVAKKEVNSVSEIVRELLGD